MGVCVNILEIHVQSNQDCLATILIHLVVCVNTDVYTSLWHPLYCPVLPILHCDPEFCIIFLSVISLGNFSDTETKDTVSLLLKPISVWYFPRLYSPWDEFITFTIDLIGITKVETNPCISMRTIQRDKKNNRKKTPSSFSLWNFFGEK